MEDIEKEEKNEEGEHTMSVHRKVSEDYKHTQIKGFSKRSWHILARTSSDSHTSTSLRMKIEDGRSLP